MNLKWTRPLPSIEVLRDWFDYDASTGIITSKKSSSIGRKISSGHLMIRCEGRGYLNHRIIWKMITGEDPGSLEIDHINGVCDDNRFSNLRLVNHRQQVYNSKVRSDSKSGFKGVRISRNGRYRAVIRNHNRKWVSLGCFNTAELASEAYIKAAKELQGEFFNMRNIKRLE